MPKTASTCPGCNRRHRPADIGLVEHAMPRHSPLLRSARRARHVYLACGWVATVLALAALVRFLAGFERVADELEDGAAADLTRWTERLLAVVVIGIVSAAAATGLWSRRSHRNLRVMGVADPATSPWSITGWLIPGRLALERKLALDESWRGTSPSLAALPASGWSRQPVSRVVLHWWTLWLWVPATVLLVVVLAGSGLDDAASGPELRLATVAAAAAIVASLRALYDVVGIITVAQHHEAEAVLRRERGLSIVRATSEVPWPA